MTPITLELLKILLDLKLNFNEKDGHHRLDGPAIEIIAGCDIYYINNIHYMTFYKEL